MRTNTGREHRKSARGVRHRALRTVLSVVLLGGLVAAVLAWPTIRAQVRAATWEPEKPSGPDHMTPRMTAARDAVVKAFDLKGTPGCYREEGGIAGGGEHPLGRACDFMLGPAGQMPTAERAALGREMVAWVQEHADEYGIWYVIYEQRIWSSRRPWEGWKKMEDRGSITQNHYDHVHISVY